MAATGVGGASGGDMMAKKMAANINWTHTMF